SITVSPLGSTAELFYTPPAFFLRQGVEDQRFDTFKRRQRGVRLMVYQQDVGTSSIDIDLRRPPVFLVHGLFGNIHVWKDFQPLVKPGGQIGLVLADVTQSDAQYYLDRLGFDDRFDLFTVGAPA